jgi:hypothetical protein
MRVKAKKMDVLLLAAIMGMWFGLCAWSTFAADTPTCDQIQTACGQAGFTRDMPEGKDLVTKCYQPLLRGQSVEGVPMDPDKIKKCNEELKEKPRKKRRR